MKKIITILTILLLIPFAYSVTLQEVINSYDLSYAQDFNVTNINYINETLKIETNNKYGDYNLILNLGDTTKIEKSIYLKQGNNLFNISIPCKYLDNNLSFKAYKDNTLMYRNYNLYQFNLTNQTTVNSSNLTLYLDSNFEIDELNENNNYLSLSEQICYNQTGNYLYNCN